jgi:hypothetical protein
MKLPLDIIIIIYEYDSTYYEYMNKNILPYIHNYLVYTFISNFSNDTLFLVIDKINNTTIVTNNLENPRFITMYYFYDNNMFTNKKKIFIDLNTINKFINYEF